LEKEQGEDEVIAQKVADEERANKVFAMGMTPEKMPSVVHHPNPSINIAEIYGGMDTSFVQTKFEHEHDNDDIVPEFTENVVVENKLVKSDMRKVDFAGEKFEEVYDD